MSTKDIQPNPKKYHFFPREERVEFEEDNTAEEKKVTRVSKKDLSKE